MPSITIASCLIPLSDGSYDLEIGYYDEKGNYAKHITIASAELEEGEIYYDGKWRKVLSYDLQGHWFVEEI